jgi:hypothetical protein
MALGFPEINGHAVSWASIRVNEGQTELGGLTNVSYKCTTERADVRGAGRQKRGRTRGPVSYEASLTWIFEDAMAFVNGLGAGFMDKPFDLHITYEEDTTLHTVDLLGCVMKEFGSDAQQGPEGLTIPMPLDVVLIKIDGLHLTEDMIG